MFLKEVLKKLRNKLLVKVLEKQDELSIKTEDLTKLTSVQLSELRQSVKTSADIQTELWASLERASTKAASKQEAVELKTVINALQADVEKTLSAVARVQMELQASLEKATASAVSKQEATELKAEIKMLRADVEQSTPVSLKAEKGLRNYLRLLKSLCRRYVIIIAVRDTTGAFLTDDIATGIKALGFTVDLSFEKGLKWQHHTYIGIIDRGEVICETLSKQKEPSYYTATWDRVSYEVVSKSYSEGSTAVIKIDGVDYATNRRGLNIAVFDPIAKLVIDSVCFDTHVAAFVCSRIEEIVDNLQERMTAFALCGYTVPQYCIDNKFTNIVVYSEEAYWNITGNICLSFSLNRKINVWAYCAVRPFQRTPLDDNRVFQSLNFVNIDEVQLTSDDTVLVIHPSPHREVLIRFEDSGSRVITLDKIVVWMHNYIFRGVRSLINYSKKCPDVRIICYRFPSFPMKDWSAGEREIKEKELSYGKIRSALKNGQLITRSFDDLHYTNEELLELFDICDRTYNLDGEYVFKDKQGRLANYANGRRVTIGQPDRHKRSIFIIGPCNIAGLFAPDDKTICSYLQRRFNEDVAELGIIVENCGIYLGNLNDKHKKLSYIFTKPNDIILTDIWAPEYFPSIDLKDLFQRPHNYGEVWIDPSHHYNANGYRAFAEALFKSLQEHNFYEDKLPPPPLDQYLLLQHHRCSASRKTA